MTSYRQFEANRRNALKSTGPKTEAGKEVSRRNAVRHGLTAETIISALEDADDYKAFEAAITADYDAQSAVERELVLRLASVLWRLRRATTMETGLFEHADHSNWGLCWCLRESNLPNFALDRLSRYETNLWRQAGRILHALEMLDRRKPQERRRSSLVRSEASISQQSAETKACRQLLAVLPLES
jgi:hypothetical protein